ncbi:aldose epimerase family protein [Duganella qianjiadongensis]|uniref:Aldose 1-epimerase n=1 Tax=Duganella qianjiadongensis TaxID=2692176 RepID=A0ABW9VIA4_9BURK|nr:aldose epimerase family protein [Duganella qianjiadongensis]MYM39351.1 galactose-1-epimerase [Duganella qianjiadongensis]
MQASISSSPFGPLPDGRAATLYTLRNRHGMQVSISNLGGVITSILVPDRQGQLGDVCLGFDDAAAYMGESHYFGALIGRYGNRIAQGQFELDGKRYQLDINNGRHHLHGGRDGFHRRLWQAEPSASAETATLTLRYRSPDGEQGYPGNLDVTVHYELGSDNALHIAFHAVSDQATPVNLTNHAYFNLAGQGDILGHELTIPADAYTPVDAGLIPTGELRAVQGSAFDFRTPAAIGSRINHEDQQLAYGSGYDHNFALNRQQQGTLELAARVREPVSGRVLEVWGQGPGVQFYSGNFLSEALQGKGRVYRFRSGFCLEPQHFPDAPNQPQFASTILRPGSEYRTRMAYRFSTDAAAGSAPAACPVQQSS